MTKKGIILCEESQAVMNEFNKLGHDFYSCDVLPTSGNNPERHFQADAETIITKDYDFAGTHPPCQYLANSGVRWLASKTEKPGFTWSSKYNIYISIMNALRKCKKRPIFFYQCLTKQRKQERAMSKTQFCTNMQWR